MHQSQNPYIFEMLELEETLWNDSCFPGSGHGHAKIPLMGQYKDDDDDQDPLTKTCCT